MNRSRVPRAAGVERPARGATAYRAIVTGLLIAILIGVANHLHDGGVGARELAAKVDTRTLREVLNRYKIDNRRFPTEAEGLAALTNSEKRYLDKLPVDPWGQPYRYANPGKRQEVEVFSYGPDGKPGTDDDIGSWEKYETVQPHE
jgi:general secretion pathway protein G